LRLAVRLLAWLGAYVELRAQGGYQQGDWTPYYPSDGTVMVRLDILEFSKIFPATFCARKICATTYPIHPYFSYNNQYPRRLIAINTSIFGHYWAI
jgi:hypothetical protein